jgi:hypothetical protein
MCGKVRSGDIATVGFAVIAQVWPDKTSKFSLRTIISEHAAPEKRWQSLQWQLQTVKGEAFSR